MILTEYHLTPKASSWTRSGNGPHWPFSQQIHHEYRLKLPTPNNHNSSSASGYWSTKSSSPSINLSTFNRTLHRIMSLELSSLYPS